jgi:hypothetical protein
MGVHPCDLSPVRRDPDGNVRGTGQKKSGKGTVKYSTVQDESCGSHGRQPLYHWQLDV